MMVLMMRKEMASFCETILSTWMDEISRWRWMGFMMNDGITGLTGYSFKAV